MIIVLALGHVPGLRLGARGVPSGVNIYFVEHGHVAYQIDGANG